MGANETTACLLAFLLVCYYCIAHCTLLVSGFNYYTLPMPERDRKRKPSGRLIGEPNEDDNPARRRETTTSASISTRIVPDVHAPSLATLCARTFASNFRKLATREGTWPQTKLWLDRLPEHVVPNLLVLISNHTPELLSHGVIAQVRLPSQAFSVTEHCDSISFEAPASP
jgi:hypothetical protein